MTFPINIKIDSFEVSSHLLFELLAYSIGFRYFLYLRKRTIDTISNDNRTLIFIAAALGAFLGSRFIAYFETPEFYNGIFSFTAFYANKTIVGGLLGGLLGVEICKKIIGVTKSSGDLMTYPLILAMVIGRIGCFLAGLEDGTYGKATTLPWAIDFGDHVYRHPTNLYEILFLILCALFLYFLEFKFKLADGSKFKLFLFSYLLFRFFIEFIKPVFTIAIGLSSLQIATLVGILYYYKIVFNSKSLIEKRTNA